MEYDDAVAALKNCNTPDDIAAEARATIARVEAEANAAAEARMAQRDADRVALAAALEADRLAAEAELTERLTAEAAARAADRESLAEPPLVADDADDPAPSMYGQH